MARVPRADSEFGDVTDPSHRNVIENRGRKKGAQPLVELQKRSLEFFGQGCSVAQVMAKLDRTPQTYKLWRAKTPGYAESVDRIRAKLDGKQPEVTVGDFASFRKKYLGMDTFRHQWQWVDLLEGNDPRDLHDAQVYTEGGKGKRRILINTPPDHGKSTTITVDYVTYRICRDPHVRVIIISASEDMAKKFLLSIKERLTHPRYADLQNDFAPAGGFQDPHTPWDAKKIYIAGRNPEEKDPTVEALGMNGTIYGSRADLIILDDCVTGKSTRTKNARENALKFIRKEVSSRLNPAHGRMLVVGTRLSSDDLYGEIIRQDEGRNIWTYLTQPAILEYGENGEHQTLWPERIDAEFLNGMMLEFGDDISDFQLVYMQKSQPGDATFPEEVVRECVTSDRGVGRIPEWLRPGGMSGLYVVGGVDPAAAGHTAIVILGVDKRTKMRYLIDCSNVRGMKPHVLREKIIEWTKTYSVNEWRIEKNGLQTLLSQDRDLRAGVLAQSSRIVEHHTLDYGHSGKWDPDFGIASLAPLFLGGAERPKANLITIPFNGTHKATRELIDQFINWEPNTAGKTDLVMAFWFADLGCRKQLQVGQQMHAPNRWLNGRRREQRDVINIQDWLERQSA